MGPLDNCKEVIEGLESTNEQVIDHNSRRSSVC
jgi:hypothetical protein